jgi:hypothetical protein
MMTSGDDGVAEGTMQTTTKIVVRHSRRVGRKTTRGEDLEQSHRSASKKNLIRSLEILFALSRCRTTRARGSENMLSHLPMHADTRDGVVYMVAA